MVGGCVFIVGGVVGGVRVLVMVVGGGKILVSMFLINVV